MDTKEHTLEIGYMKKQWIVLTVALLLVLGGCSGNKNQKVTCVMCNGSGEVKYYYAEGENDYNMGPCSSCDAKGYTMITPSGSSDRGNRVICGSCESYVDSLVTKKDAAGENRTWCVDCWKSYDDIMGR